MVRDRVARLDSSPLLLWLLNSTLLRSLPVELASSLGCDSCAQICALSLTWRGKLTPAKSWLRAAKRKPWIQRLFGRIAQASTHVRFEAWWISSLEASRVRTSPTQANAQAWQERDPVSGNSSNESSKSLSLDLSSLKTSRRSGRAGSTKSSPTLPRSGSMRNGALSERPTLEPLTGVIASSSWPTPSVAEANAGVDRRQRKNGKRLSTAALLWPTPTVQDSSSSGAVGYSTESGRHSGVTLTDAAVRGFGRQALRPPPCLQARS